MKKLLFGSTSCFLSGPKTGWTRKRLGGPKNVKGQQDLEIAVIVFILDWNGLLTHVRGSIKPILL